MRTHFISFKSWCFSWVTIKADVHRKFNQHAYRQDKLKELDRKDAQNDLVGLC